MSQKQSKSFLNEESFFEGSYDRNLWQSLKRVWFIFLPLIVCIFLVGVAGRLSILSISVVIGAWADSVCTSAACSATMWPINLEDSWSYIKLAGALLGFGFLGGGTFLIGFTMIGAKASEIIHNETIMNVSRLPMSLLDRTPIGNLYTRFSSDFNQLVMSGGPHLAQLIMVVIDITIMLSVITWIDWRFALICIPFLAFDAWIYRGNSLKVRELRRRSSSARSPSVAHFASTIKGYLSIELFGKKNAFVDRFENMLHKYYQAKSSADLYFYFFGLKISLATALLMLSLGLTSVYLISIGEVSIGSSGVVISYIAVVSSFIQRMFTLVTSLEQGLASIERIHEFMSKPSEAYSAFPKSSVFASLESKNRQESEFRPDQIDLNISNLSFQYGPDLPFVLKDFTLSVEKGESVGIIGRTGSGKSSLLQVLLRLYPIQSGSISIGGFELDSDTAMEKKRLSLNDWRNQFSFMTQEPFILRGSIRENLDTQKNKNNSELIEVLQMVGLWDWVQSFPQKLEANLAEDGANMSAGQKQQLSTARCLLRNSPIVLMDEATSSVDPESEQIFIRSTEEWLKDKTRLIIAHRLTTVLGCDKVAWIQDGRVHQFGDPATVIAEFQKTHTIEEDNTNGIS